MKKAFYLFLLIPAVVFGQLPETEKGIHFEQGTFASLVEKAKKENKMIMLDAYTTWCGPCKWMAKNIFPNDTVAAYYNANFINAKIDMEKGEGIDIAKKYQVSCYPTYLFIDGNGQLAHRISSSMPAKQFVEQGMNAMDPAKRFVTYQKKYDSGKSTPDEMAEYILMRGRTCLPAKDEMAKYFSTQKDEDLTQKRNWSLLWENRISINTDSREFRYFIDHQTDFEKLYEPTEVTRVAKDAYTFALYNDVKSKNTDAYNKRKAEILQRNFSFSEEMVLSSDMSLYQANKDWKQYAENSAKYIEKFKKDDYNTLNNIAWDFYENVDDKAMLAKAEGWIKHSVELQPGYFNYDTYAAVLYKLGKKTEAKATAEKAIELAKKTGDDYKATQEMLDKINAMK